MLKRLVAVLAIVLVAAAAAAAGTGTGRLAILSKDPFAVRGTTFQPGEHVLVVVSAGDQHGSKRLTPGTRGGFVARFPSISVSGCAAFAVRASGDEGTRAVMRVMPECPQPLTP